MEETRLLNLCIEKDDAAWSEFVERYSGLVRWAIDNRLKKWGYSYCPQDVEEIRQNVFFTLWHKDKLCRIKEQKALKAWIVIVSGNEAVDYFRHRKCQYPPNAISIFEEITKRDKTIKIADMLYSGQEEEPDRSADILEREIEKLTDREKIILRLDTLYGKKYREIAEILHMPMGSVSTALRNIKKKLKQKCLSVRLI